QPTDSSCHGTGSGYFGRLVIYREARCMGSKIAITILPEFDTGPIRVLQIEADQRPSIKIDFHISQQTTVRLQVEGTTVPPQGHPAIQRAIRVQSHQIQALADQQVTVRQQKYGGRAEDRLERWIHHSIGEQSDEIRHAGSVDRIKLTADENPLVRLNEYAINDGYVVDRVGLREEGYPKAIVEQSVCVKAIQVSDGSTQGWQQNPTVPLQHRHV